MSASEPTNPWVIDEARQWPPTKRPSAPFGPTALEVMRSCPLRSCFEASPGYERRTGYAARIGTAFHRTLQSLSEKPVVGASNAQVAEEARNRFTAEMARQDEQKAIRPRERECPREEGRIARATEAIMVEALRLPHFSHPVAPAPDSSESKARNVEDGVPTTEVEVPVRSADGLLHGRIDCAIHTREGTRLIDYKSAMRDDLPERYERQLQLYAMLWRETRNEWPTAAEVIYPFMGTTHQVTIEPETCERVSAESHKLIGRVLRAGPIDQLATPGDVCRACEFRPWCKPFWKWQAAAQPHRLALERAALGFEGAITAIVSVGGFWKVQVLWGAAMIRIVAPVERFPQLSHAQVGTRIRALDMRLQGQLYQPQAVVTEYSELFLFA